MAQNEPTSVNRFRIEVDGVSVISAVKGTPSGFKQTLGKYQAGNELSPRYFPGNFEVEEMSFTQAHGIGQAGFQLVNWLIDASKGVAVERKTLRYIRMDSTGRTPIDTWECRDCLPTYFKPSDGDGSSTDTATFDFKLQPESVRLI